MTTSLPTHVMRATGGATPSQQQDHGMMISRDSQECPRRKLRTIHSLARMTAMVLTFLSRIPPSSARLVSPLPSMRERENFTTLVDGRTSGRKLQTQQCTIGLIVGDVDRNDQLDQEEYIRFLNQLSQKEFDNFSFDDLHCYFRETYFEFADSTSGTIDVMGSKQGSNPNSVQEAHIEAICNATFANLERYNDDPSNTDCQKGPTPAPSGTPAPTDDIDCSDTIGRQQCDAALTSADLSRDNDLDEAEYVRFVNRLSQDEFDNFSDLPAKIQTNFWKLAIDGVVDITGSKPGSSPNDEQDQFIDTFCCQTDLAWRKPATVAPTSAETLAPTVPPTASPTASPTVQPTPTEPPKVSPGESKGGSAGLIIALIVGGIALCAGIGYVSPRFRRNGSAKVDHDDKDDDDASDIEKGDDFGHDSDDGRSRIYGAEEFGANHDTMNKKKRNRGGIDPDADLDVSEFGNDSVDLFAYDESSENGNLQERGSVESKDETPGEDDSTGWGNTAKGGAEFFDGGGWRDTDNVDVDGDGKNGFFGNAAFGTEEENGGTSSVSDSEGDSDATSEEFTFSPTDDQESQEEGSDSCSSDEGSSSYSSSFSHRQDKTGDMSDTDDRSSDGSSPEEASKYSQGSGSLPADFGDSNRSESVSETTESTLNLEKWREYRAQVEALVRLVLPNELEKVPEMMEQFMGREAELVSTLQNIQERSATQRALAAVHKSKSRPKRGEDGWFTLPGGSGTVGSTVIASASLPIPAGDFDQDSFGSGRDSFGNEEDDGSYYSDEDRSRSYSGSYSGSSSYYSGEHESYTEGSRSRTSRSYYSDEEGSQHSGSLSQYSEGQHSGSHSRNSGNQNHRGRGCQYSDGDDRSGSKRIYSGENDKSYTQHSMEAGW